MPFPLPIAIARSLSLGSSMSTSLLWAVFLVCAAAAVSPAPFHMHAPPSRRDQVYYHLGCYTGWINGSRVLRGPSLAADDMSVDKCASFCSRNRYFGLEFGRECYCGDVQIGWPTVSPSDCSFACPGDAAQKCGAGNTQNLYINLVYSPRLPAVLAGATHIGCFVDEGPRTLPDNMLGADDMTGQKCQTRCIGYRFFGVEFRRECFCGRTKPNVTAPTPECSLPCAGDDNQLCGGPNRINVWDRGG